MKILRKLALYINIIVKSDKKPYLKMQILSKESLLTCVMGKLDIKHCLTYDVVLMTDA